MITIKVKHFTNGYSMNNGQNGSWIHSVGYSDDH